LAGTGAALNLDQAGAFMRQTHDVVNQGTVLQDLNLFETDHALVEHCRAHGAHPFVESLRALGDDLGRADTLELGRLANEYPPRLHTHDRFGRRTDRIEFHPAWHALMTRLIEAGTHSQPWADPGPGAQVARAARYLMFAQVENGTQCPVTMTYAAVPVIARHAALARDWLPVLLSRHYDPSAGPVHTKRGALVGMGMTEKQGGSDVRANSTRAEPAGEGQWGARFMLTGHKWFFSAPMCDAFLVLAQEGDGDGRSPSCFFMPRWLDDGRPNAITIQRLKDKLGNRSNASSEVELDRAMAYRIGEPGRGIATILEMGNLTRLDCALGTAGMMRWALANALHHARLRHAFGRALVEQPLMRNVLADLAIESEAATALSLRLARALDQRDDPSCAALLRLGTPLAKYWICKRGPGFAAEAMEVLGGNGYTEEAPMARLYREMPVNSIWEGSGNVICLDVLRVLGRHADSVDALRTELAAARGADRRFDRAFAQLDAMLTQSGEDPAQARRLSERLACAWQAALLLQHAPAAVADAWCASRLGESAHTGFSFGTLPASVDTRAIIARAMPG
jgi:putative acyl-CoA dehydrogenase